MWFRLLGAKFTASQKTILLGSLRLENATDLLPLAEVEYPSANTDATFIVKQGNAEIARIQPGQTLSIPETLNGDYELYAQLNGGVDFSPLLYSGVQLVQGKLGQTANYVSRAFPCGPNKAALVTLDTFQPGGSSVQPYIETAPGVWTEAALCSAANIGDGWQESVFSADCGAQEIRVKIVLTGSPSERPRARSLRTVILDA
jgi:hypothetical protein